MCKNEVHPRGGQKRRYTKIEKYLRWAESRLRKTPHLGINEMESWHFDCLVNASTIRSGLPIALQSRLPAVLRFYLLHCNLGCLLRRNFDSLLLCDFHCLLRSAISTTISTVYCVLRLQLPTTILIDCCALQFLLSAARCIFGCLRSCLLVCYRIAAQIPIRKA